MDAYAQLRQRGVEAMRHIASTLPECADPRTLQDAAMLLLYRSLLQGVNGADLECRCPRLQRAVELADTTPAPPPPDLALLIDNLGPDAATPRGIGAIHEALLGVRLRVDGRSPPTVEPADQRKSAGAFYTPPGLVDHIIDVAVRPAVARCIERLKTAPTRANLPRVLDPAMGVGHFLFAAGRAIADAVEAAQDSIDLTPLLHDEDAPRRTRLERLVAENCLYGVDVDPFAVAIARALMSDERTSQPDHLRCFDALASSINPDSPDSWTRQFPTVFQRDTPGFDAVIGNPPFQSQLAQSTTRTKDTVADLRALHPAAVGAYTDTAAVFLLKGVCLTAEGGRVAMVQPQSILGTRDTSGVRSACLERASLESLWFSDRPVFDDTSVRVCIPCLHLAAANETVEVHVGMPVARVITCDQVSESWVALMASGLGVPNCQIATTARVKDVADVTADFRDQYYDLANLVNEASNAPPHTAPLLTTGLVDLAACNWGRSPARYAKRRWQAPVVDLERLRTETPHAAWAARRLVPKIIIATQTRVLEAFVDEQGDYLPMTPLISVTPRPGAPIWSLAAALASPVVSVIARRASAGAALSTDAIKLSAAQVRALPIPDLTSDAMTRAGELFHAASHTAETAERNPHLLEAAALTCAAYEADHPDTLINWWASRLDALSRT